MSSQAALTVPIPRLQRAPPGGIPPEVRGCAVRQEWRDPHGALLASGGIEEGRYWMHWPSAGTFVFAPTAGDVVVHTVPGATVAEVDDTFIRGVLPVVFIARGHEAFHASAVLIDGRLVAFAAESGTGKSTLAAAVARLRGAQWADDTTVWSLADDAAMSVALPHPSRLDPAARVAVSAMAAEPRCAEPGVTAPLTALYIVKRVTRGPASVEFGRLSPAVAFRRMLSHTHPFDLVADRPRRMIERVLALASVLPVFALTIRSGFEHLPVVADLAGRHAAAIHRA